MADEQIVVKNNEAANRYEVELAGQTAVLTYMREGKQIIFLHTGVPPALEGHGIANKLARTALEDARANGLVVEPECQFVASYIRRHQEYLDLVPESERAYLQRD
ncbi:MAG: N-acetyltransferase [Chloroflexota bacterium]|nr:N-acetyltransferase [Chloroflexota bacterium]